MNGFRSEAQTEGPQTTADDLSLSKQAQSALGTDSTDPFDRYLKRMQDSTSVERKKAQEAQTDISTKQIEMEKNRLKQEYDLATKQSGETRGIISDYSKQLMAPSPKREIEAQTKEGMMGLAALLPVAGAFFGGKGLTSATGAMQAMTGLVKGYQEGNKERIAFEQKKYDDAIKEFDRHQQQIKTAFDMALKNAQINQNAAQAKLKMDLYTLNSPMLAELVEKQGIVKTSEANIQMIDNVAKMRLQHEERVNIEKTKADLKYGTSGQPIYSDDAVNMMVDRYMAGDPKALVGLGTGIAAQREKSRIMSVIAQRMHEAGASPEDILVAQSRFSGLQAGQRTLAQSEVRVGQAQQEALNLAKPALDLSEKIDRAKFVPLNKLMQTAEANISDPELLSFKAANNSFLMAYTRALAPTGVPTDFVRRHAYELLSTAFDHESYKRVMDQLKVEMDAAMKAPSDMRNKFEKEFSRKFSGTETTAPSGAVEDPLGLR